MPYAPKGPCSEPGCPGRAIKGGRCAAHQRAAPPRPVSDRPSTAAQGYGAKWRALRARYLKVHPMCQWPGCGAPARDVDHIIPKTRGGGDEWDNLQALCHSHHSSKTAIESNALRRTTGAGWAKVPAGHQPRPKTHAQFAARTRDVDRAGLRVVHICGAVATGKSTVRRLLDERLGLPTFSIDEERASIIGRRDTWVTDDEELRAWVGLENAMLAEGLCAIETSGRHRNVFAMLAGVTVFTVLCVAPDAVREQRLHERMQGDYFLPMGADYVQRMMRIGPPNVWADFTWDSVTADEGQAERLLAAVEEFLRAGESETPPASEK